MNGEGTGISKLRAQIFSFGLIGVASNAVAYAMFLLLVTYLGVVPEIAMAIVYVLAASSSYLANWRVTFAARGTAERTVPRFILAHVGGFGLNLILLHTFSTKLGFSAALVQFVAIFVVAAYLFSALRLFVFR